MLKNLVITCDSEEEEKEVLKILEKHGNEWNSGKKATKSAFFRDWKKNYCLMVCNDGAIVWGNGKVYENGESSPIAKNVRVITAEEFVKEYAKNQCIVIYRNGSETIALDKTTGKKAVAHCHPDDAYDIYVGAKLALDRLTDGTGVETPQHVNCKCSTVTEVKRKARVGEYVKIVNACGYDYKNGDILEIISTRKVLENIVPYYGTESGQYLWGYEYVVLEGYKPEEKPEENPKQNNVDHPAH